MRKEILEYSFKHSLGHIPSALSMVDYLQSVFKYVKRNDKIIIGKPFGAQAYYVIWKSKGWIRDINNLHMGVKHDEITFVDYSEETIGNALGVASGVAMTTEKPVYVNITDASLQMGNTLEALQFIGHHNQKNIICTVDYNNAQVTDITARILGVEPTLTLAQNYGWDVYVVDGHNIKQTDVIIEQAYRNMTNPSMVVCLTKKGKGILEMENNTKKWHYGKLNEENLSSFLREVRG